MFVLENEATFVPVKLYDQTGWSLTARKVRNRFRKQWKLTHFDLQLHIGFAVLVSWCPVKLLENPESWNQKNSGGFIWNTFQAFKMYYTWCTWCESCFWNIYFPQFRESDQIWRGHKIVSFDPVITNSSATDSPWPWLYVCIHFNATCPRRKARSKRTLLLRPNEHERTNEPVWKYTRVLNLVLMSTQPRQLSFLHRKSY
jgi:hypothetical protein